jgi:hypothetical protein
MREDAGLYGLELVIVENAIIFRVREVHQCCGSMEIKQYTVRRNEELFVVKGPYHIDQTRRTCKLQRPCMVSLSKNVTRSLPVQVHYTYLSREAELEINNNRRVSCNFLKERKREHYLK